MCEKKMKAGKRKSLINRNTQYVCDVQSFQLFGLRAGGSVFSTSFPFLLFSSLIPFHEFPWNSSSSPIISAPCWVTADEEEEEDDANDNEIEEEEEAENNDDGDACDHGGW